MAETHLTPERFPTIYEDGRPTAVVVDLTTFRALLAAVERLEQLDLADEGWLAGIIERVRAYRRQHPDELITYDTPETALAALDAPDA